MKLCSRLSQGSTQVKVRKGRALTDAASRYTGEPEPIKPRTVRSAASAEMPRGIFHGDADPPSWAAKGTEKRKTQTAQKAAWTRDRHLCIEVTRDLWYRIGPPLRIVEDTLGQPGTRVPYPETPR